MLHNGHSNESYGTARDRSNESYGTARDRSNESYGTVTVQMKVMAL